MIRQGVDSFTQANFSFKNRLLRFCWIVVWKLLASWTPAPLHKWRILLINVFGGEVSYKAFVYGTTKIWAPWHLTMQDYATLGPFVECYNIQQVTLNYKAIASQGAKLYTGTHDYNDVNFQLLARPIVIQDYAWVAASSFVGPGVEIAEGAILGATGTSFKDLEAWTIYVGNPAVKVKQRVPFND